MDAYLQKPAVRWILHAGILPAALLLWIGAAGRLPQWAGFLGPAAITAAGGLLLRLRFADAKAAAKAKALLESTRPLTAADMADTMPAPIAAALAERMDAESEKTARLERQNRDLQVQLQLQKNQDIRTVINSLHDPVLITDELDRILLANSSAERLFGFRFEPNGTPVEAVEGCRPLAGLIQKARCSRTAHVRHELTFADDPPLTCAAVLSGVEDESGRIVQVVSVLHDITREKEAARMKNDFVSHVSHELKTPLASINAYAEMLVDGEAQDPESLHQFCSIIQAQAQRLNRLIEDILNISRIESGLTKISKERHSLALVIRDAVRMIESYAGEKNITVVSPATILYDQVYIDRDMISQVVINLLSNAVKYTPAGGRIEIASEMNEADNIITVTVADTGVGIPPEEAARVFDKFYRVKANDKYAKGTGLGLNLVKQIVETVHEGSVFVTSTPGEGSTFGFTLPLSETRSARMAKC